MKRISMMFLVLAATALLASAFVGCDSSYRDKQADKVKKVEGKKKSEAKKAAKEKKKAEKAAAEAAKPKPPVKTAVDDINCWGKQDTAATIGAFEVGGVKYSLKDGYKISSEPDLSKPLVLGLLSDLKSNIPENIKNINYFFEEFKKAGVSAVVVSGDTSEKYDMLKPMFELLAQQGYLTMVVIGNRESKEDYVKAIGEVQAKYKNLIDLNRIRSVELGVATIVSMPGYYDPNFIHFSPGCAYTATHIDVVKKLVSEATTPVVLVSHGPPRGVGPDAIDNAVEAGNVGDPQLAKLIAEAKIPFGIFGNIHEAGGKAVGADMTKVLEQGKMHKNLYLNTGPGDSDPWKMNDGTISRGLAAIMTIKAGEASYKAIRAK